VAFVPPSTYVLFKDAVYIYIKLVTDEWISM